MRLGLCCCGSTTPCSTCPALPSDWSTRDYKLFVPSVTPVTYGRYSATPSFLYTGPCNSGDPYWSRPECDFDFTGKFPYTHPVYESCAPGSWPFCLEAGSIAPRNIGGINTGNMVPQITSSNGEANFSFGVVDPNGWSIAVNIKRCYGGPFFAPCLGCENRTLVTLNYTWFYQYTYNDNCRTATGGNSLRLELTYFSDPFNTATGIGRICYLRSWAIGPYPVVFCFPETGARACANFCSLGPCSFDGSSNFPATVLIS